MPPILSLLKYSYTNRRSTPLVIYSVLTTIWAVFWLLSWTLTFIFSEPDGEGGPSLYLAAMCGWSTFVAAFCVLPVAIQLAWAYKVQKEETAAMQGPWQYGAPPTFQAPPMPLAYPPPYVVAPLGPDPRLEEERRRVRELEYERARLEEDRRRASELEYENARLRKKLRERETPPVEAVTDERLARACALERIRKYGEAGQLYEEMGLWEDATRVRMLQIRGGNL